MDSEKLYPGKKHGTIFKCLFDLGLKNLVFKLTFLALNDDEKWSRFFYFEIQ